jgi:hypothetical protein
LYIRSLSLDAFQVILIGKKLVRTSNNITTSTSTFMTRKYPELTMAERWELSDLVYHVPTRDQLFFRAVAEKLIRSHLVDVNHLGTLPPWPRMYVTASPIASQLSATKAAGHDNTAFLTQRLTRSSNEACPSVF